MTRTVLLTLGRLPKALDLARSFAGHGWRVVIAEPFPRHLAGASRVVSCSRVVTAPVTDRKQYLDDLRRIIDEERVSLVVPVSEEAMHVAFLRDSLPATTTLFAMPPQVLLELHDKQRFVARCAALGLAAPETFALGDAGALGLAARGPFVVKPVYSCSGRGVSFHARGEALPGRASQGRAIAQRFVEGSVFSSFTIAARGRVRITVVYRGAVMSGTVAVCFERVAQPAIERWVETFVTGTGFSGFISFDFVVDGSGAAQAIECNPRATSGIHFVHPEDLAAAVADPQSAEPVRFREQRTMQQLFPCLTETQKSMFGPRFRSNLRHLLSARDVTWRRDDPLPLLTMPFTSWPIIAMSIRRRCTFGEVATLDVGWYEDDVPS
jgi:predicted ATP-grasp superfamily ATP-dependent carboligase